MNPHQYNEHINDNIDLVCGDPLVELQANAMNALANTKIPGINSWLSIIDWLNNFLEQAKEKYDNVFIDTNPSFSLYTQIALSASHGVVIPVMADDSSRRAFQNVLSLLYGIRLPSSVYEQYTFANQMNQSQRPLPKIQLIIKNRITQYMGDASAYSGVLGKIEEELSETITSYPQYFEFNRLEDGIVSVRDFGTTGVVAFARGCPFSRMSAKSYSIGSKRVQVKGEYLDNMKENMDNMIDKL